MSDSDAGSPEADFDSLDWGTIKDWGELVRLPAAFTLISNCLAAAIVAGSQWLPLTALLPTLVASLFAYWAGMILNDVIDVAADRETRPNRPLAAGRISPVVAGHVASGMLLIGPIIILAVNTLHSANQLLLGAAFAASVLLSFCVRAYNSRFKETPLGPLLMGGCRGLNILMVGFTMVGVSAPTDELTQMPTSLLWLAAGVALYILGVTIYGSREELSESSKPILVLGILFEVAGLVCLALLPWQHSDTQMWTLDPQRGYPLLIGLIGITVVNRSFAAVWHPVSRKVQLGVKHALLTLILLDAAIVYTWEGAWYGAAIVFLLLPALTSAIRFRTT